MIIECTSILARPSWYRRRVMRRVTREIATSPGFHRLIIVIPAGGARQAIHADALVNPAIEPRIRSLMSRICILAPPEVDDEPWPP